MNSNNRGFIKVLLALTIGACLIVLLIYFAGPYLAGGFYQTAATSTVGNSQPPGFAPAPINPLLSFLHGGVSGGGNPTGSGSGSANGSINSETGGSLGAGSGTSDSLGNSTTSPYANEVYLGPGDASSDIQPDTEYITLSNNSQSSVDITGWTVENGASDRPFQTIGNQSVNVGAKAIKIPQGTQFLSPNGNDTVGDIILKPGDSAVINVGGPFTSYTFAIPVSFRENICSGYFNYTYPFNPQIQDECPTAQNEPDSSSLTDVCFNYVKNFQSCYNPQLQDANNFKNTLQQNCMDYITSHMNYPGCVANHGNDVDFSLPVWRIFLGQNQAMWRSQDDKIVLLDRNGKTVSEIDY